MLFTDDIGISAARYLGFKGLFMLQVIEVFEKQHLGSLFSIIPLARAAGFFPENVVDAFKGLLEQRTLIVL